MTPVIIDIIILAVLLLSVLIGARQGLFRALAGLVILILALVGASVLARTLTPAVTEWIFPIWEQRVNETVEDTVEQQVPQQVQDLLERFGVDPVDRVEEAGSAAIVAATKEVMTSLTYSVLHLISFILLMVGLHLLARAIGLLLKIPFLREANAFGGAVIGLLRGVLLVYFLLWLAARFGYSWNPEETYILRAFLTYTPAKWLAYL